MIWAALILAAALIACAMIARETIIKRGLIQAEISRNLKEACARIAETTAHMTRVGVNMERTANNQAITSEMQRDAARALSNQAGIKAEFSGFGHKNNVTPLRPFPDGGAA